MTYCRHPSDTEYDAEARDQRAARHPAPWEDIEHDRRATLADAKAEVVRLEQEAAELAAEIAAMARTRDPALVRWCQMELDNAADLARARAAVEREESGDV